VADDAGALLVRSGLVSASALDGARAKATSSGGTIGEHLVSAGVIGDDLLTDFYRSRLLVPQVNPNTLARLSAKVVAVIPADMAIELRVVPVSLDRDGNLTLAMSDPSDRHAVDEISFFTGTYVVRAVATQMQIAWCLAHYYGHVTPLGQRLLQPTAQGKAAAVTTGPTPRVRGLTAEVEASRHKVLAGVAPGGANVAIGAVGSEDPTPALGTRPAPASADDDVTPPTGVVDAPRARSVSGEIKIPSRRAASIKPPLPEDRDTSDDSGPVITVVAASIEVAPLEEPPTLPGLRPAPRRRAVDPDPPELAARAGEVSIATGPLRAVDLDEPRVVISDDALAPPPTMARVEVSGEIRTPTARPQAVIVDAPSAKIELSEDPSIQILIGDPPTGETRRAPPGEAEAGAVIHDRLGGTESQPILLDRRRDSTPPDDQRSQPTLRMAVPGAPTAAADGADSDVVVLDARKPRPEKRTQIGIGITTAQTRTSRDTEANVFAMDGIPREVDDHGSGDGDVTQATVLPEDTDPSSTAAHRADDDDTNPRVAPAPTAVGITAAPRAPMPPRLPAQVVTHDDDDDDEDTDAGRETSVMTAVELDRAIPDRRADVVPAHLAGRRSASIMLPSDPLDDGWGPPGTTIPPPFLGAIPGSEHPRSQGTIPLSTSDDSAPLMVTQPTPPEPPRGSGPSIVLDGSSLGLVRALEHATARAIELIRDLEHTRDRDEVLDLLIAHLGESHRRAGFFALKNAELSVFAMSPRPATLPLATLRLDRPSTMQDLVGTRLPYRGPIGDDATRTFLTSVLGAPPTEILLVPVAVRERVVGVLFGDHRLRHTFDDQLAMVARAAGIALERIVKLRRS
jgi:hypothetical protein